MAQPNVAREPSMDEILASIRKIIESNEPGLPGFPANDLGPGPDDGYRGERAYDDADADDIHLTIDDEVLVSEFEAEEERREFAPELQVTLPPATLPQPEVAKPAVSVSSSPPLSLADVAARVRAASERHAMPFREPENTAGLRTKIESPMVASRMTPPVQAPLNPEPEPVAAPAQVSVPVDEEKNETVEPIPAIAEPVAADISHASALVSEKPSIISEKDVAAIVSPAVGEQVARSFGDLALALDNSPRRSFDEIAEDMLRPMLQEWLDDNLPTLVERLVREEIERVARGPRR